MFEFIRDWLDRRIIGRSEITEKQWNHAFNELPLLHGLGKEDKRRLRELTIVFMHRKVFDGKHGLEITLPMKMHIALQACLPILNLGLYCYRKWYTIIIYPTAFVAKNVIRDEAGVEHHVHSELTGEAWHRGPVVLAWETSQRAGELDGHNVVIHEFAHKLDMQNGVANGYPPLHKGMDRNRWVATFSGGFDDFQERCQRNEHIGIDYYAATAPAEFFAVLSEVFFEKPSVLQHYYPDIYKLLRQYYRQDPLQRLHLA
jgi:Mlc titration factor MtfA (ptsG expression regulator)